MPDIFDEFMDELRRRQAGGRGPRGPRRVGPEDPGSEEPGPDDQDPVEPPPSEPGRDGPGRDGPGRDGQPRRQEPRRVRPASQGPRLRTWVVVAIAALLVLNPLMPDGYVDADVALVDDETLEVSIGPCDALDDRDTPSPLDTLRDDDPAVIATVVRAVNPRAKVDRVDERRWSVRIDPDAEPVPEHPMAELVGGCNYYPADLSPRPVAVTL